MSAGRARRWARAAVRSVAHKARCAAGAFVGHEARRAASAGGPLPAPEWRDTARRALRGGDAGGARVSPGCTALPQLPLAFAAVTGFPNSDACPELRGAHSDAGREPNGGVAVPAQPGASRVPYAAVGRGVGAAHAPARTTGAGTPRADVAAAAPGFARAESAGTQLARARDDAASRARRGAAGSRSQSPSVAAVAQMSGDPARARGATAGPRSRSLSVAAAGQTAADPTVPEHAAFCAGSRSSSEGEHGADGARTGGSPEGEPGARRGARPGRERGADGVRSSERRSDGGGTEAARPGGRVSGLRWRELAIRACYSADTDYGSFVRSAFGGASGSSPRVANAAPSARASAAGAERAADGECWLARQLTIPPAPAPGRSAGRGGSRSRRRAREKAVAAQSLTLVTCALLWGELGRPRRCPESCRKEPSRVQQRALGRLGRLVRASLRAECEVTVTAETGRSGRAYFDALSKLAESGAAEAGYGVRRSQVPPARTGPDARGGPPRGASSMTLVPERVDLPANAGTFDPSPHLPPEMAAAFADPRLLEDGERAAGGPRGGHWAAGAPSRSRGTRTHCSDTREMLRRMDCAGMLEAGFEEDLENAGYPSVEAAGLFAVDKGGGRQRLISNRKARNARERSLGASGQLFPHASHVCSVLLGEGERLRGSGDDLPDFYHSIATPAGRWPSNQVGPSFRLGAVREFGGVQRLLARHAEDRKLPWEVPPTYPVVRPPERGDRRRVRFLQRTLPMGDVNATDFAEVAHANVLAAGGALDMEAWMSYRAPTPAGRLLQLLMVDDHNVLYRMRAGERAEDRGEDDALLEAADKAYAAAGLEPKPSKRFRKLLDFDLLGAHVRSGTWIGAKREAIGFATLLAAAIAEARSCTGAQLASAVALWGHACLFRRPAFAFFDEVYREVARLGPNSARITRLSRRSADELLVMLSLAPLLGTDLTAPVVPRIVASDACGGAFPGMGGAEGDVSPAVAEELWRQRRRKGIGEATPYNGGLLEVSDQSYFRKVFGRDPEYVLAHPAERDEDGVPLVARDAFGDVCDAVEFRPTFHARPPREHVNLLETRAVRTALRREARRRNRRHGHRGARVLVACDSEVTAHALAKGRSPSRPLGRLCKSAAATQLAHGLEIGLLPVPTHQQPADEPSRGRRMRSVADKRPKEWAREFVGGAVHTFPKRVDARGSFLLANRRARPSLGSKWIAEADRGC